MRFLFIEILRFESAIHIWKTVNEATSVNAQTKRKALITTTNKKTQNNHLKTTGNNHKGSGGPGSSGLRQGQGAGLGGVSEQGHRELGKGPWGARQGASGTRGWGCSPGVLARGGGRPRGVGVLVVFRHDPVTDRLL